MKIPLTPKKNLKTFHTVGFPPIGTSHNIDMWHAGILHHNKLKQILVQLTQHHPVIRASISYELKCVPFDYYTHYNHIIYTWTDRRLGFHNYLHKWGKIIPSNVTSPFNTGHRIQRRTYILNKSHYTTLHQYTPNYMLMSILSFLL